MVSAEHYSHLTVQRVQAANNKDYTVLFLLTDRAHIIEEVQVFEQPQLVKSLKLSIPSTLALLCSENLGVIYVGTSEGVVRVPIANCSFYWTCAQCVLARDPFCGWDSVNRACVEASNAQTSLGQDVDRGSVEEACNSVTLTHRVRFGPNSLPAVSRSVPAVPAEVGASQQPAVLGPVPAPGDGSLSFVATPATLGHYLCLSTENGFQQTMAIYHVKQKSSPVAQTPTSHTRLRRAPYPPLRLWPGLDLDLGLDCTPLLDLEEKTQGVITRQLGRNFTMWTQDPRQKDADPGDGEPLQSARGPCYLKELVVVSVLLVLCLSLLITIFLYIIRHRCRRQTAPQAGTPTRDPDRRTPVEQEALRGNQFLSKRNGQSVHSGQASGLGCNGALTGSNGHLPNTPI
ncbi:hypothetical protein INR49_007766 [Caranx melampygus]|nr:hypothetical protein INR49_007766 [Caranx melampygus]